MEFPLSSFWKFGTIPLEELMKNRLCTVTPQVPLRDLLTNLRLISGTHSPNKHIFPPANNSDLKFTT